jgi:AraC-like DNA-binding protein
MATPRPDPARGILQPPAGERRFRLDRYLPADDLDAIVEHHWIVRWELPAGERHVQENLAYPSVHLVLERDGSAVFGVPTGRFARVLEGRGRVHGVKFRPGAFRAFLTGPVSAISDREVPLARLFGEEAGGLEDAVLGVPDDDAGVRAAEAFLRARRPAPDRSAHLARRVVETIERERRITRVEDVARRFQVGPRSLQRLFREYVGVSPKWVIKRFRLHQALDRVSAGEEVDWSELALELGYFDQAHFIRDFKAIIGEPPTGYAGREPRQSGAVTDRSSR